MTPMVPRTVPPRPVSAPSAAPCPARGDDVAGHREQEAAENFPVALRVLPAALRTHLRAVYDVVRTIDDLGDEAAGDRTALLEAFARDVRALERGEQPREPVLRRLVPTWTQCALPAAPFLSLVAAGLQDQRVHSYATYADLRAYCALSAEPVGRLVLALFDAATPQAQVLSDRVCAALQLLEHWQDVAEDRRAGRCYLPVEDLVAFGVAEEDLAGPSSPAVRALMAFETQRAERLLRDGAAIVEELSGWARLAVAGYVAGGLATVDTLRRPGTDVLLATPRPRRADLFRHLALTLRRRT